MPREIRLPQLGETMNEGTIVDCTVKVGSQVKKGDVIFEVETDKATLEVESPADGFVKHILAEVGQTLQVGQPVMVLGEKDEEVPQTFLDSLKTGAAPAIPAEGAAAAPAKETSKLEIRDSKFPKVMASPRAKKLAEQLGVDLAKVAGTGPAGKITEQDVQNAAAGTKVLAPANGRGTPADRRGLIGQTIPLNRLQRITAEKMLKSKREIPCFYLTVRADVTDLVGLRARLNEAADIKISYNDFIIKAVAIGLEKYPVMTGQLVGDSIKLADSINVGLAISVVDGLVAPIIKDASRKDVRQIARDRETLIEKARNNKLAPTDLEGGCITVSNLGSFGIESFIPIVVPGQCSILGIGKITDTCVPQDGNILVRKLMSMTLSVDHKVTNGAYAAQFLDFVRKQLEDVEIVN